MEILEDEDDVDDDDTVEPAPQANGSTAHMKQATRQTLWRKADLDNAALPEYEHSPPEFVETPFQYFSRFFSSEMIKHITYQTNLYASQFDVNSTFFNTEKEVMNFIGLLIHMGINVLPSSDDHWAMETRVSQVAQLVSSKRFRLMKKLIHFIRSLEPVTDCSRSGVAGRVL